MHRPVPRLSYPSAPTWGVSVFGGGRNGKCGDFSTHTRFSNTGCRGGRPCPPSKSGVFPWSFVGADAHIGPPKCCEFASDFRKTRQFRRADRVVRPSKSGDFPWSFVGADAHIGPSKYCDFASDFRKNGHFPRADRVVRPYDAKWEINMDSPENHHKTGAFGGSMWASTPTERNRNPVQ